MINVKESAMKKIIALFLSVLFMIVTAGLCNAGETVGSIVLVDTLYGTATGTIIGAALMLLTHKPSDHWEYIGYGTATGAIAGMLFGMYEATAFVELEDETIKIAMPTITTSSNAIAGGGIQTAMELLRVRF
jgi:hypothetical protein